MANLRMSRRRAQKTIPDISLTPLIDTALTLLIIFMVTAPMMQNAIRVSLPKGQAHEHERTQEEVIVTIDKDGNLFFNGMPVANFDMLMSKIKAMTGTTHEKIVFVQADEAVRYGKVLELVDNIKVIGGISYVALATKPT